MLVNSLLIHLPLARILSLICRYLEYSFFAISMACLKTSASCSSAHWPFMGQNSQANFLGNKKSTYTWWSHTPWSRDKFVCQQIMFSPRRFSSLLYFWVKYLMTGAPANRRPSMIKSWKKPLFQKTLSPPITCVTSPQVHVRCRIDIKSPQTLLMTPPTSCCWSLCCVYRFRGWTCD